MVPGKCPKCEKTVFGVNVYAIDARRGPAQSALKAISLNCQNCHTVLGMTIDPLVVKTEAVAELIKEIRRQGESQMA